jgi:RNA polymerase sigma-70 factor (ECF subfamily)
MLAIVRNAWLDEVRLRRRHEAALTRAHETFDVPDLSSASELDRWSIQGALEQLPDEQRLAVALVLLEGLPYKEAAEIMSTPIGTLTSRLARGRLALESMLAEDVAPRRTHGV